MGSSSNTSIGKLRSELTLREFFTVPETAKLLRLDERTVRSACRRGPEAGGIPATRIGARWLIPTMWLRAKVGAGQDSHAA